MYAFCRIAARLAAISAVVAFATTASAQSLEKVTYNMSWLPQGSSIGAIVAQAEGYYKDVGLEVNIVRGYGGNRTANELDQGQFEFAYVDPISLALTRSNGGHVRLIGAVNTSWPGGICYIEKNGKRLTLNDMKGMTLGGGSASPVHNIVPVWLEMNGKPRDYIKLLRMDPAVVDASLVDGKIDLAECWRASNRATILKQANEAGVKIGWIEYSDYGLNAYGSGLATTDERIAKSPGLVKRFVQATYRGYQFALDKPDAAADIMVKMFPTVDRNVGLQQIREINELIVDPGARDKRLGYLRSDRMQSTAKFVDKAFTLGGKVKAADLYTDAFVK
jgi:NitT/TauT family transport system substrate-binding protein